MSVKDAVYQPSHYTKGIECREYLRSVLSTEAWLGFCQGNVTKYLHRWKDKNGVEDLRKAAVYLGWMIQSMEDKQ